METAGHCTGEELPIHERETNTEATSVDSATNDAALHAQNANSRTIFHNPTLACQFLKGYLDLPIFENLKPEDIEDVTPLYQAYLGIEFETDTVKRIRLTINGTEQEIYVISLIEHKSYVDYDVSMQLLRYMVVIWHEFAKQKNREKEGASSRKDFRYPLIIPIVYYEGARRWTADLHLHNRIEGWKYAKKLVPDFVYRVVRIHDYTNEKLAEHNDEISLAFLFNKIQTVKDYKEFLQTSRDFVNRVYQNAPEDIRTIFQDILWALLMKMKVPTEDAQKMMEEMEGGRMGYLFENMEKMDIQAERRKVQKAEERLENYKKKTQKQMQRLKQACLDAQAQMKQADLDAKAQIEQVNRENQLAKAQIEQANRENQLAKAQIEQANRENQLAKAQIEQANRESQLARAQTNQIVLTLISLCKQEGLTKEETITKLKDVYQISDQAIDAGMKQF